VQRLSHDKGFPEFPPPDKSATPTIRSTPTPSMSAWPPNSSPTAFNLNLARRVVDLRRGDEKTSQSRPGTQLWRAAQACRGVRQGVLCRASRLRGVLTALKHFPGRGDSGSDNTCRRREYLCELEARGTGALSRVDQIRHCGDDHVQPCRASRYVRRSRFARVAVGKDYHQAAARRFGLHRASSSATIWRRGPWSSASPPKTALCGQIRAGNDLIVIGNQAQPSLDLAERLTAAVQRAVESGTLKPRADRGLI